MPRKRRRPRSERSKSFISIDAANNWAKENNVKAYEVKKLNFGLSKKFKIVEK